MNTYLPFLLVGGLAIAGYFIVKQKSTSASVIIEPSGQSVQATFPDNSAQYQAQLQSELGRRQIASELAQAKLASDLERYRIDQEAKIYLAQIQAQNRVDNAASAMSAATPISTINTA